MVNDRGWGLFHDKWLNYRLAYGHFIMSHSPIVYCTPCHLLRVSQDLLATEAPQMAATQVICSVHKSEVCCITINQPGTRVVTCSEKVREGACDASAVLTRMIVLVMLPWLPRHMRLYCTLNFSECVRISPGYSGICVHSTQT